MKTAYTSEEAGKFLAAMKENNDVVRIVDPEKRIVLQGENGKNGIETATTCHAIWGKCERCENCTSLRAKQTKGTAYKMEIMKGHTYWVQSSYIEIDGMSGVAEFVKDVTNGLYMDSDQQDRIGHLIMNYNQSLITDPLTGVYNRRFLEESFLPSLQCCHDTETTVNLAFLDMDDFKTINDRYGHSAGDQVLKDVGGFWKLHFDSREKNHECLVIRYGGDEFLIVVCGMSQEQFELRMHCCYQEMRKICYTSETTRFPFDFTYGTSSTEEIGQDWTWEALLKAADCNMYRLKTEKARFDPFASTEEL
ncbi:MAG: GGDEF domain-containing protein [Lachnospiraceae bacterium]|nr:GGDEF domain-containing protein [Lachnospiraceae bacterium]